MVLDPRYAFEHGTSGGGVLITATEPSEQYLAQLPPRTRNVRGAAGEVGPMVVEMLMKLMNF